MVAEQVLGVVRLLRVEDVTTDVDFVTIEALYHK